MPALPSCLLEPLWDQFAALLPARDDYVPTHPLGCHRRRIPDRVVFEHIVQALVHGSGYERIASSGLLRPHHPTPRQALGTDGHSEQVHALALQAYDRMIGLDWPRSPWTAASPRRPSGGEKAGRSPVDRGKQGLKRSVATDAAGVPLGIVSAGANRHDSPLLGPTLEATKDQVGALPEQ